MKLRIMILVIILAILATGGSVLAEEDITENACYAGGTMEGQCDLATEAETNWAWTCGWYIARVDSGKWGAEAVPSWCNYKRVIEESTASTPVQLSTCYDAQAPNWIDMRLTGQLNTTGNVTFYNSFNGTCNQVNNTATNHYFVVESPSTNDANADCAALRPNGFVYTYLTPLYPSIPGNWYLCS